MANSLADAKKAALVKVVTDYPLALTTVASNKSVADLKKDYIVKVAKSYGR